MRHFDLAAPGIDVKQDAKGRLKMNPPILRTRFAQGVGILLKLEIKGVGGSGHLGAELSV